MTAPGGSDFFSKSKRRAMKDANEAVNETNQALSTAREALSPGHPQVKKLVADSTENVKKRSKAIKDYQFAREIGSEE